MSAPGHLNPRSNRLLAALPATTLDRLAPRLERVRADQGDVLVRADQPIERVCFPTGGLFSLVVKSGDGDAVEAAVAGREGMLGSAVLLGAPTSMFEELCQVEDGDVLALPARYLLREIAPDG